MVITSSLVLLKVEAVELKPGMKQKNKINAIFDLIKLVVTENNL